MACTFFPKFFNCKESLKDLLVFDGVFKPSKWRNLFSPIMQ